MRKLQYELEDFKNLRVEFNKEVSKYFLAKSLETKR